MAVLHCTDFFWNTNYQDMFRTLVAALTLESVMVVILFLRNIPGQALLQWYRQLGTSALIMDVLSAYVCVHTSRMITSNPLYLPLVVLLIQIGHDLLFGLLVSRIPHGKMKVIDLFKSYARPAIIGYDAVIVLGVLAIDVALELAVPDKFYSLTGAISAYVGLMFVHCF